MRVPTMGGNISTEITLAVAISGPSIREDTMVEDTMVEVATVAEADMAEVVVEAMEGVAVTAEAAAGIIINRALTNFRF
jgi:hypothetical protein